MALPALLPRDDIDVGGDECLRGDLVGVSRRGVFIGVLVPKDITSSFIVLFHRFRFPRRIPAIVGFDRRQSQALRTRPFERLAFHFSAPLRQDDEDLQRRQTRSPAHALGNGDRQIRHFLIFSSTVRSSSCVDCRRMTSGSLSSSNTKSLQ